MKILGIETSCDETAVSVISAEKNSISVLSNAVSSQIKLHSKWGGVVPNLAAREHLKNITPVLELALREAKTSPEKIDLIAVTKGPGLIPALLVGVDTAKTLSYVWKKPLLGIHHIEGHIYANFIQNKLNKSKNIQFPVLCLVVSGGHTQLVLMKKHLDYKIIGETLDDAVGEAFDKAARILGLGYPGGPEIASIAAKHKKSKASEKNDTLRLPRPMIHSKDLNFSFSGLKTALLYSVKKNSKYKSQISTYCHEFQQAAVDVLISKTMKATMQHNPKTILLAGGVSANQELRRQLGEAIKRNFPNINYQLPDTCYSIDNAAMIASAGYFRWKTLSKSQLQKTRQEWETLRADANLKLS